ncbi:Phage-related protein [Alistipes sp. cv1]|nr:Phage-related protein [Faecalibacterium prausnitzii]
MSRYYKHNHMNRKPRFEVKYYREAEEFLQRIEEKTRKKILENVDKARYTLDPKLLKKLTGDVWEFRTLYQGKQYRMLAFWDKRDGNNTLVIATHGFIKKVSKVPGKEIEKTERIMTVYFGED